MAIICVYVNSKKKMASVQYVKDSVFKHKFRFESDIVDIKNYFKNYEKLLHSIDRCQEGVCKTSMNESLGCQKDTCKNDKFYTSLLGVSLEELKELKVKTSLDHLTCEGEIEPVPHNVFYKFNETMFKNDSSEHQKKAQNSLVSVQKRAEISEFYKFFFSKKSLKYTNYEWCCLNDKNARTKVDFNSEDFSNVVVCVKVYYPFLSLQNKFSKLKLLQEIHILGYQNLAELRDKIICTFDYMGDTDESYDCFLKDVGVNVAAKEIYPSSFIFIENTFYNDTRQPNFVDLSEEIREWGSKRDLGPFETGSMEKTRICNLKLKLGKPYVFQHQGNCEHILVFSDIRFLQLSDPSRSTLFPKIHCTGRVYGKHCMMCSDSYARWLVVGNERLTHDKAYLCNKCFISYNYIKNKKIGEFKAYKYVDPVALL